MPVLPMTELSLFSVVPLAKLVVRGTTVLELMVARIELPPTTDVIVVW